MIPFHKVGAIGNDFPLVLERDVKQQDLPSLAIAMSDRHMGVGGDGLLVLGEPSSGPDGILVSLRMFNPDGTEDFCGNGIRAAAQFAFQKGLVPGTFVIKHLDRLVNVRIQDSGLIETDIGSATYDPEKVPVSGFEHFDVNVWSGMDSGMPLALFGSVLSTGSTHTVIHTMALPDDDSFASISAKIEVDPRFPARTSVIWSQTLSPRELKIRIWERGVGETQGCGTGSAAAAVDYLRRQQIGGEVVVHNPGGNVSVRAKSWDAPLTLIGNAEVVFSGVFLLS